MSKIELLPCPFCGAPGRISSASAAVYCSNKGCDVHPASVAYTKKLAVAAWNRRAPSPEPPPVAHVDPPRSGAAEGNEAEAAAPIHPTDPITTIAGIRQFGLSSDGSDLRDLEAAIHRLQGASLAALIPDVPVVAWRAGVNSIELYKTEFEAKDAADFAHNIVGASSICEPLVRQSDHLAAVERLTRERDAAINDVELLRDNLRATTEQDSADLAEMDRQRLAAEAAVEKLRKALRPFAQGEIDVSGAAVIIGFPAAKKALNDARAALPEKENSDAD